METMLLVLVLALTVHALCKLFSNFAKTSIFRFVEHLLFLFSILVNFFHLFGEFLVLFGFYKRGFDCAFSVMHRSQKDFIPC